MKNIKLQLIVSLISILGYSQTDRALALPTDRDVHSLDSLYSYFSRLDASKISNGLLLDAAVEFINMQKYDGTLPDSSYTSSKAIVDIYNTLITSRLYDKADITKTPEEFTNVWKSAQIPDFIPLGGVFYKYSRFADNAYTAGKITYSNGVFSDKYVGGVWQNPYEEKYVFALAPSDNSFNKFNFQIALPEDLFLTNQEDNIRQIEYKLADDRPYQVLTKNQLINVQYAAAGEYTWTFKLTLAGGQVLYSHNLFKVQGNLDKYTEAVQTSKTANLSEYTKVFIDSYQVTTSFFPYVTYTKPKATLYIKLAPGHTQITKPLIVAEGFDMGCIVSPSQEAGLTNIEDFLNGNGMASALSEQLKNYLTGNYDLIYVDWGNGVDYIQNNAELFKKAIKWVNENKAGTEKNIVLGQSMGGLVARYALKDMEDKGENHNTRLFISHDAPHLGANIPIGLQDMLVNISKTYLKTPVSIAGEFFIPIFNQGVSINDIFTLTDTPAARQMMINYVNRSYGIDNSVHNAWQAELKAKGYPQQTRNVAISNGSECGTDENLQDLLTLYKETGNRDLFLDFLGIFIGALTGHLDMVFYAALPGSTKYIFDFYVKPMTKQNETNKRIYHGNIKYKKKILWFIPAQVTLLNGNNNQPQGIFPYDKYGGGKFTLAMDELPAFIKNDLQMNPFSFIPTPSALDFYSGNKTLAEADYQKSWSPADDAANVPFANFVAEEMSSNNTHISFSNRNGQFIMNQLSTNTSLQNQKLTTAYLCGNKASIGGKSLNCGRESQTYTTGFAPNILWTVTQGSELINITTPPNQPQLSFIPKENANGQVMLTAKLSNEDGTLSTTSAKSVWIGSPVFLHLVSPSNNSPYIYYFELTPLDKQSVSSIKWSKYFTSANTNVTLSAPENSTKGSVIATSSPPWFVDIKVDVANDCGTKSEIFRIADNTDPCKDPAYDLITIAQNRYEIHISYPVTCTNKTARTTNASAKSEEGNYQITVANALGNIV